jgi:hypothetical protein
MIRNLYFSTLLLALSVVFFSACKKETDSPTQGELTTNELKTVIEKNGIKRIYPVRKNEVFPNQFSAEVGTQWTFSNGFIYIYNSAFMQGYNLNYLVGYGVANVSLNNGTSDRALILYMEL